MDLMTGRSGRAAQAVLLLAMIAFVVVSAVHFNRLYELTLHRVPTVADVRRIPRLAQVLSNVRDEAIECVHENQDAGIVVVVLQMGERALGAALAEQGWSRSGTVGRFDIHRFPPLPDTFAVAVVGSCAVLYWSGDGGAVRVRDEWLAAAVARAEARRSAGGGCE